MNLRKQSSGCIPFTGTIELSAQLRDCKLELNKARQQHFEARQECKTLKRKAEYEKKYRRLKNDYNLLLSQFEQSEALRLD